METIKNSKIWYVYGSLLVIALILRFQQLQIPFLSEREAAVALQAIEKSQAVPGAAGINGWLQILFFIFGENEVSARIIPAIFGFLMIVTPLFFSKLIGKETAILLSILIMFDPGQIAFSRQVDGAIITLFGLMFALGCVFEKKSIPAGIAIGLAFLGSPVFWPALISIFLALRFTYFNRRYDDSSARASLVWDGLEFRHGLLALVLTVLLAGSGMGFHMAGAAAPFIHLMDYLKGWTTGGGISPILLLFSFLLYQPVVFIIGLVEGIRSIRERDLFNAFLIRLFGFSLLLAILYPSRDMDGMLVSYLPLLFLAARFVSRLIPSLGKPDLTAYGQMLLVILLVPFIWMNLIILEFPVEGQDSTLRLAAVVGGFVLLIIASLLIRLGWSPIQASTGLWMGTAVLLFVFMFSTAWRASGIGSFPEAELWNYYGVTDEVDLLRDTAGDLSEWNIMSRSGINIVILNNTSSALRWALRDFSSVNNDTSLPNLSNPAIVITENEEVPTLAQAYRGQDFVITKRTAWSMILPEEWIQWYAFRSLPVERLEKILWARTDLFPGASSTAPETITPIQ
ncbi:MAG: hypothetical protein GX577_09910 [Leptolinea sp.]|nr:hypothetical protein [Leptolinea sp.]